MIISIIFSIFLLIFLFLNSNFLKVESTFFAHKYKKNIFSYIDSKISFKSNLDLINMFLYCFLILQVSITLFSTNLLNPIIIYFISWIFFIIFVFLSFYKLISMFIFLFKKQVHLGIFFPINILFTIILFTFFLLLFFVSSYGSDENFYINISAYFKNGYYSWGQNYLNLNSNSINLIYQDSDNIYNFTGSYFFYGSLSIFDKSVVPFFTIFSPLLQLSIIFLFIKEIILYIFPKKFLSFFVYLFFFLILIVQFLFNLTYLRSQNNIFFQVSILGMIYFFVAKKDMHLRILSFYGMLSFFSITGILLTISFLAGYLIFRFLTKINEASKNIFILINLVFLVLVIFFLYKTNAVLFTLFSIIYALNIVLQKIFYLKFENLFKLFDKKILSFWLYKNKHWNSFFKKKYVYLFYFLSFYILIILFLVLSLYLKPQIPFINEIISFVSLTTILFVSLIYIFIKEKNSNFNLYIFTISFSGSLLLFLFSYFFSTNGSAFRVGFSVFMWYDSFLAQLIVIFIYFLFFLNYLKEINFFIYLKKLKINFTFKKLKNLFLYSLAFVLQIGIFISSYQPIKPAIFDFSRQQIISYNDNVFKNINLLNSDDINYLNSLNNPLNSNKTFFTDIQSESYLIPYLINTTWIFNKIPDFIEKFGFNSADIHHYMSLGLSFGYSTPNNKLQNILIAITTIAKGEVLYNDFVDGIKKIGIYYPSPDYFIFRKDSRYFFINDSENINESVLSTHLYNIDFESNDMIVFAKL